MTSKREIEILRKNKELTDRIRDFGNEIKLDIIGYYKVRASPDPLYMTNAERLERQNMNVMDHHPSVCPSIADIDPIENSFPPIPVFINHTEKDLVGRCKSIFMSQRIVNGARELHYEILVPNNLITKLMDHFFTHHYTHSAPWLMDYYEPLSFEDKKLVDVWYASKQINNISNYAQLLGRSVKCSNQYEFTFEGSGDKWRATNFKIYEISFTNSPRYSKCTPIFVTNSLGMLYIFFLYIKFIKNNHFKKKKKPKCQVLPLIILLRRLLIM